MHDTTPLTRPTLGRRQFLFGGAALALAACTSSSKSTTNSGATDVSTHTTDSNACYSITTDTSAAVLQEVAVDASVSTQGFNLLWIPPTLTGTKFDLALAPSTVQFFDGAPTDTIGYNGASFWGPTLIMTKGDTVGITVTNSLDEETTTHWHGVHLPAEMDGGPMQVIDPGCAWSATFEVMNNASTYWYHPHAHELTWKQLNLGAGGFIIVQDDIESALALPRTYGVDDIPLILTSRKFGTDNAIETTGIYGDYMLTNGTMSAEVNLPAQLVRFRILNGEIERAYTLGFADDRKFWVIATDGGLVDAPVEVSRLTMVPGERYEIIVDLGADAVGSDLTMQAFNGGYSLGYPGSESATTGAFGSLLNNTTFDILRINVIASRADGVTSLPTKLTSNALWSAADATNERTIEITDNGPGSPFTFNNSGFDMNTINERVVLDTVEAWNIQNGQIFGHSFHIHDVQFAIVERSTGPVPGYEKGWKDTCYVQINEQVTFIAKFEDYASNDHPFMYHCHMANHEDEGLMGQFLVVPK
ncbi:MAG: multicopper oxidase domain-containing protein [Actinobacteria bacterium]|uniref:Multicopper oxidase CueO n=1 Tax=freshwater metagenome TaxID=449393 RepID=A0A6J7C2F7_9ZZZZ|nr:multicopper oxidase domain-containing protein [Actinomycetota bacterium]